MVSENSLYKIVTDLNSLHTKNQNYNMGSARNNFIFDFHIFFKLLVMRNISFTIETRAFMSYTYKAQHSYSCWQSGVPWSWSADADFSAKQLHAYVGRPPGGDCSNYI